MLDWRVDKESISWLGIGDLILRRALQGASLEVGERVESLDQLCDFYLTMVVGYFTSARKRLTEGSGEKYPTLLQSSVQAYKKRRKK
jgi:hypothetical protein